MMAFSSGRNVLISAQGKKERKEGEKRKGEKKHRVKDCIKVNGHSFTEMIESMKRSPECQKHLRVSKSILLETGDALMPLSQGSFSFMQQVEKLMRLWEELEPWGAELSTAKSQKEPDC